MFSHRSKCITVRDRLGIPFSWLEPQIEACCNCASCRPRLRSNSGHPATPRSATLFEDGKHAGLWWTLGRNLGTLVQMNPQQSGCVAQTASNKCFNLER
ncbi:MAG: hypothetical protein JWN70_4392 [Planctomycetaceae bacterium]|nr:hypothetical protein [Planctomycetaceae bacterium]